MFTFFNTSTNETFTKKIEIISSSKNNNRWYSIVASLIILFGIFYGNQEFKKFKERNEAKRTLAKVTEVLKIVSSNLKKGNQALNNLYVYEDTVYKILKKVNIK